MTSVVPPYYATHDYWTRMTGSLLRQHGVANPDETAIRQLSAHIVEQIRASAPKPPTLQTALLIQEVQFLASSPPTLAAAPSAAPVPARVNTVV